MLNIRDMIIFIKYFLYHMSEFNFYNDLLKFLFNFQKMLNLEDPLWSRVSFGIQGIPLDYPNEIVHAQFPDTSLTIPTLRFGEVGTFAFTNKRFIFIMYQRNYALSFAYIDNINSSQSFILPANPKLGYIKIKTNQMTTFTIQTYKVYIEQISALIKKKFPSNIRMVDEDIDGIKKIADKQKHEANVRSDAIMEGTSDLEALKRSAEKLKNIARELASRVDGDNPDQVKSLDDIYKIIDYDGTNSSVKLDLTQDFSNCISEYFKKSKNVSFLTPAEGFVIFNKIKLTKKDGNFISPKELIQTLNVIKNGSNYPIKVEDLEIVHENGSKTHNQIIVEKGKSFNEISDRLSSLKVGEYVTSFSLSKQLNISNEIVKMYLQKAHSNKIVVLDSSYAGERYYKNFFPKFKPMKF